jgi:hypothetical protein
VLAEPLVGVERRRRRDGVAGLPLLAAIRAGDEAAARSQTAAYLDDHLRQLGGDAG